MPQYTDIAGIPYFTFDDFCDVLRARFNARPKTSYEEIEIWTLAPEGQENPLLEFTVEKPVHKDRQGNPVYSIAAAQVKVEWIAKTFETRINEQLAERLADHNHVGSMSCDPKKFTH